MKIKSVFGGGKERSLAGKVAVAYALASAAWIYYSDQALAIVVADAQLLTVFQTYKGLLYVVMTSALLYATIRAYMKDILTGQQELRNAEREIIERLSRAAEYRDDETGNHARRVGQYCAAIGRSAGLGEEPCATLELAASLHDVGKIGIPDSVMLKDGAFTDQDRTTMQAHTLIGSSLLSGGTSPIVLVAASIALTHHERWDGAGYPNGLSGEDIPIEGRICAIADVFDALISRRRYKESWTFEDAVAEIERQGGMQFDPGLVEKFVAILPQIRAICDENPDALEPARYQAAA